MSKNQARPTSRKKDIVVQEYNNEILIYDLSLHKAFSLNETSALVWQACDGSKTVSEISRQISKQLKSPVTEDFVWLALDQLKQDNLLEEDTVPANPFEGLSRREVIRKVGYASLVALPVIASLVAPTAIMAQSTNCAAVSGRTNGCTCTANGQCASACCGSTGVAPFICVTPSLEGTGSACRVGCECISGCCVAGTCRSGDLPLGSACTTTCECQNTCVANVCT
jgi:hypothetical protein